MNLILALACYTPASYDAAYVDASCERAAGCPRSSAPAPSFDECADLNEGRYDDCDVIDQGAADACLQFLRVATCDEFNAWDGDGPDACRAAVDCG